MECTLLIAFVTLATICDQPMRALAKMCRSIHGSANCIGDSTCPTWFICTSQNNCQCGSRHKGEIMCEQSHYSSCVLDCYCVTYDDDTQMTHLGSCFYNCHNNAKYSSLPNNPKQLINKSVCTQFHRTGLLCGDCEEGHSPFVLSYNLSCVRCPDGHKNWWKFILAGFVPLTFFYFIVLLFNINVTSSRLHGIVWFSQAISMPVLTRGTLLAIVKQKPVLRAVKVLLVFYSFWNLDLFRSVIPHICLNVTTLQALALDYLVAFYPFLLLLTSYFFIKLYDRKICYLAIIWKPFQNVISVFHKSWKVHTSLIDAFATFFLLSYIKIMNVTMDILIPTEIYQLGSNTSKLGLFYSPTITYFGHDHLPYAIFALAVFLLFVIIPIILLILYPFKCFQKVLSFIPLRWNILHGFVDTFQGCYKDGTESGTFDCRWFSVLMLLIRLIINIMLTTNYSSDTLFLSTIILVLLYLIAIINIQPYKKKAVRYPSTDSQFLVFLSLCFIALLGRATLPSRSQGLRNYHTIMATLATVSAFGPLLYIIFLAGSWLVSKKR